MSKQPSPARQRKLVNYSYACHRFFVRVDRVLRRSLGVSETAKAKIDIKPAPEVDPTELEEEVPETPEYLSEEIFDEPFMKQMLFDMNMGENVHDEL